MSSFAGRVAIGSKCLEAAAGGEVRKDDPDFETYASDAISDILTHVYGKAGYYAPAAEPVFHTDRIDAARELLDRALRSYEGDAEDYEA